MVKKIVILIALLAVLGAGAVFADDEDIETREEVQAETQPEVRAEAKPHHHQPFDVLVGLNSGLGITPSFFELIGSFTSGSGSIPVSNYALTFDLGLTADFYLFPWLSFNTGLLLHPDFYILLEKDFAVGLPVCLTIPIGVHINVPYVEWLYAGIGLNLNIPLFSPMDNLTDLIPDMANDLLKEYTGIDIKNLKGDFFVGLPIDIGFDTFKNKKPGEKKGGGRFFFRITPEFHKNGMTTVPIGFMWQIWNWNVYAK